MPEPLQGRISAVYLVGVHGGIVVGAAAGGALADGWGIVAPYWFGFVGSALTLAAIWRRLSDIAASGVR